MFLLLEESYHSSSGDSLHSLIDQDEAALALTLALVRLVINYINDISLSTEKILNHLN
jgi:hypothetical protein